MTRINFGEDHYYHLKILICQRVVERTGFCPFHARGGQKTSRIWTENGQDPVGFMSVHPAQVIYLLHPA